MLTYEKEQKEFCEKKNVPWIEAPLNLKVGISKSVREGFKPINGLRHPPTETTTGWYIWAGEWSDDQNFFEPYHLGHLLESCPLVVKFLGLPPGWRFLVTDDYEDVWEDPSLLKV